MIKASFCLLFFIFYSSIANAQFTNANNNFNSFVLSSFNFKNGENLSKENEFGGFSGCGRTVIGSFSSCTSNVTNKYETEKLNCNGRNIAPTFSWSGAPAETKSFAFTIFNPDIKTASGWWHFLAYNISTTNNTLNPSKLPSDSLAINNDSGTKYFMGPCPAAGSGSNRYIFTIYALDVDKLEIATNASAALASYLINKHKISSATMVGLYERK